MKESITTAALKLGPLILTMERPARHRDILQCAQSRMPDYDLLVEATQGFLTSTGRFVDRKVALLIALTAGQVLKGNDGAKELNTEMLF